METIITQITLELLKKITDKATSENMDDLDALAADIFEDCVDSSRQIIQEVIRARNLQIRETKRFRKENGLVLKEKDRPRQIMTKLGMIEWERDYYYDRKREQYAYPLDQLLGIRGYERLGDEVCAQLLNRAAEVSYAKSTDIVTGGEVSRQSVRTHLLKADIPEKQPDQEKKEISELHVYADEDHAHLQKPCKAKGKQNQIVPLVTVTEGTHSDGSRNRTIQPVHFVDEEQSSKRLWEDVEGYIEKAYDAKNIKRIYLHSDGGGWIRSGLENFAQTIRVMDGYHFYKELRKAAKRNPERNVRVTILNALEKNDRKKADLFLNELAGTDEEILRFGTYLFNNWDEIRNLVTLNIPGSCTEGEVSHVLSERFSRNPMGWSREGLGKLTKLRVYRCNGGKLTGKDLKPEVRHEQYREYTDVFINEQLKGANDWSIFEPEQPVMDGNSGTQQLLKWYGMNNGIEKAL